MKINKFKLTLLTLILGTFSVSCSVETDSNELELGVQTFTFEDIYEGSNTSTIEVDVNSIIVSDEALSGKEIESVSIASITLMKEDSVGLGEISSSKMQIMGDGEDTPMVMVGVNSSMEGASSSAELDLLEEVDFDEYIHQKNLYSNQYQ